jgi:hypothetical protein
MLSPAAEKIINDYFNLPLPGIANVRCPYFNNSRANQRGQLRALTGKGTPNEIIAEAKIISLQYKSGLFCKNGDCAEKNDHTGAPFTADEVVKFLVDHNLGIECSGFVSQVLRAHFQETKKIDFTKKMFIVPPSHLLRWLLAKLRPIENISVRVLADDANSNHVIGGAIGYNYENVLPGDVVIMLDTGPLGKRNHILLITAKTGAIINYVHARAWTSEGRYNHGVSRGTITIMNPLKTLLEQTWTEKELSGDKNETFIEAKQARILEIKRLKV